MTILHGKCSTQEVGKPLYEIRQLFFSYDEKAKRFDAVIYTLHPAGPLYPCFEDIIEPAILSLCPPGTGRPPMASRMGPSATRRTYTYVTARWWERWRPMLALLPPRIEVTLTDSSDDSTPSTIEISQYDPKLARIVQLYDALAGRSDVSRSPVQGELDRLAQILDSVASP